MKKKSKINSFKNAWNGKIRYDKTFFKWCILMPFLFFCLVLIASHIFSLPDIIFFSLQLIYATFYVPLTFWLLWRCRKNEDVYFKTPSKKILRPLWQQYTEHRTNFYYQTFIVYSLYTLVVFIIAISFSFSVVF